MGGRDFVPFFVIFKENPNSREMGMKTY